VYKSVPSVRNAVADLRPIAVVFLCRTNKFWVILWKNINQDRCRTMHELQVRDGEVMEGTYMISKGDILDEFNDCGDAANGIEQHVIFDHTVVKESIACDVLPYHVITNNQDNDMVVSYYYYIRTENHTELKMMLSGDRPVFSYPSLYMTSGTIQEE
jgi:hypothetical protein